jgi:hypothetical protein
MRKLVEGTVEWFDWLHLAISDHARALNSILAARSAAEALRRNWENPDLEVRSALYTQIVVNYARPFIPNVVNGRMRTYPINDLKRQADFDRALHKHLVDLRNKLLAHADSEYLQGRVFHRFLDVAGKGGTVRVPIGVSVRVQALHGISDKATIEQYVGHFAAAGPCIDAKLREALDALLRAFIQYPDGFEKMDDPTHRETLGAVPAGTEHQLPDWRQLKSAQLPRPVFAVGTEGFVFRDLEFDCVLEGEVKIDSPMLQTTFLLVRKPLAEKENKDSLPG